LSETPAKEVCLVIGAGDGVGGAIGRAFAAQGMAVCVTRRARNLEQLDALAETTTMAAKPMLTVWMPVRRKKPRRYSPQSNAMWDRSV
jgi:NAD(P)-dependent dehydrogenase (short-subunit alcohol dehydrogenase family)